MKLGYDPALLEQMCPWYEDYLQTFRIERETYKRELARYFPNVLIPIILDSVGYMDEEEKIVYEITGEDVPERRWGLAYVVL